MLILASVQILLRLGPDPDRGPPIEYPWYRGSLSLSLSLCVVCGVCVCVCVWYVCVCVCLFTQVCACVCLSVSVGFRLLICLFVYSMSLFVCVCAFSVLQRLKVWCSTSTRPSSASILYIKGVVVGCF